MKYVINKTRLADSVLKLSLTAFMAEVSLWLNTPIRFFKESNFKLSENIRYIQQFTWIIAGVLAIITLRSLKALIPKAFRRAMLDKFLFAVKKAASRVSGFSKKLLGLFGIKFERYKKRKDEKSFIFGDDEEGGRKRRHSIKSSSKWRDMVDNAEKIRFLYIKYIVKLIKGGYDYRNALTPNEVRTDLALESESGDNMLFDLYNGARYSGGSAYITDEQVADMAELVNSKKKEKDKEKGKQEE